MSDTVKHLVKPLLSLELQSFQLVYVRLLANRRHAVGDVILNAKYCMLQCLNGFLFLSRGSHHALKVSVRILLNSTQLRPFVEKAIDCPLVLLRCPAVVIHFFFLIAHCLLLTSLVVVVGETARRLENRA